MELTGSAKDYLKAIYIIGKEKRVVRVKDVAKYLNIKMPSVVAMTNKMLEEKLVEHEYYGHIDLTQKGHQEAKKIYKLHQILVDFLNKILGVSKDIAEEDANKIEHDLNPVTMEYMMKLIQFTYSENIETPDWISDFRYFVKYGRRPDGTKIPFKSFDL
mgnify:FL=1